MINSIRGYIEKGRSRPTLSELHDQLAEQIEDCKEVHTVC